MSEPVENEPRAYTVAECREMICNHLQQMVDYWTTLEDDTKGIRERVEGAVFSTLVMIDGGTVPLPGFLLIPAPHSDDKAYHKQQGENWFPCPKVPTAIEMFDCAGELHSQFINTPPKP